MFYALWIMKILVVGSGGREHALAWKLASDSSTPDIFCAPGNAGTATCATNVAISADDIPALVAWSKTERPDLVVIGPEAPLCAGLADTLTAEGLAVFGPNQAASKLEGSKVFSKDVMMKAGVPTAACKAFKDADKAIAHVHKQGVPIVIKANGLAAGKGVFVCHTMADAEEAIRTTLTDKGFGEAGNEIVVEAFLRGEEASILALIDGTNIVMLASSQDHKRAFNNDEGPNTGGMGAYSPAPVVTEELWPVIREQVFEPMLKELDRRGIVYKGILYAGLMICEEGIEVLEFNCRFGDPETQAILPRIDGDLLPALQACVDGTLHEDLIRWKDEPCVCVVMASGGYPGAYKTGMAIEGLATAGERKNTEIFHAGTTVSDDGAVLTSGGRVLGVTALGEELRHATKQAYRAIADIRFDQAQYRTDIATRAVNLTS